jgi:phospholipid transport system substrate-binding protein
MFVAVALLLLAAVTQSPGAAAKEDSAQFVDALGQKAIARLAGSTLSQRELNDRFRQLLNEDFDVAAIGRMTIGRYWNTATPSQQQEYLNLFEAQLVDIYAERFRTYAGEKFTVLGQRAESDKDFIVSSQIIRRAGPPVDVEWRVRKSDKGLGIIDIAVEGVSMAMTQRAEYATILDRSGGDFGALIRALRQRPVAPAAK